ncbi:MAG: hypothetical protein IT371_28135 [Deltaproteobacteria bacterium]|nr:hypothetical protein [Deltaproteobacteria bacterium]
MSSKPRDIDGLLQEYLASVPDLAGAAADAPEPSVGGAPGDSAQAPTGELQLLIDRYLETRELAAPAMVGAREFCSPRRTTIDDLLVRMVLDAEEVAEVLTRELARHLARPPAASGAEAAASGWLRQLAATLHGRPEGPGRLQHYVEELVEHDATLHALDSWHERTIQGMPNAPAPAPPKRKS